MTLRMLVLTCIVAAITYLLLPDFVSSSSNLVRTPPTDEELGRIAASLTFRAAPKLDDGEAARAALGRRLFFDTGFSRTGEVACASCHDPKRYFTDGRPTAIGVGLTDKNAPSVLNLFASSWLFWDGRADSPAQQALGPLEAALEHGLTRGEIIKLLYLKYRAPYEKAFGPFPAELSRFLDETPDAAIAMTAPPALDELPIEVAAYSVATIGSFTMQSEVIQSAASQGVSPQRYLALQFAKQESPSPEVERYLALPKTLRQQLDQAYANVGLAIASYEKGLVAVDSPFDRFAHKLEQSRALEEALGEGFGMTELKGLKVFATNGCLSCHHGPMLSDQQFHNIGLSQRGDHLDLGRARGLLVARASPFKCKGGLLPETKAESCLELSYADPAVLENVGSFKTPSLRNVAMTAPYMHDGRFASLDEVMKFYNELDDEPAVGRREESLRPLDLDRADRKALVAFLRSLTSPVTDLTAESQAATK